METSEMVETIVRLASEKKGSEIAVMEMAGVSNMCDYFVIISAGSRPQCRAIALHIEEGIKTLDEEHKKNVQGRDECGWILMDYGNVVVHVFLEELRAYYNLEGLWKEAKIHRPRREVTA